MTRTRAVLKDIIGHFATQKEFAETCGVEVSIISRLASGAIDTPSPEIIDKICAKVCELDGQLLAETYFHDIFPDRLRNRLGGGTRGFEEEPAKYNSAATDELNHALDRLGQKARRDKQVAEWLVFSADLIATAPSKQAKKSRKSHT